jgi:hypothetical protein
LQACKWATKIKNFEEHLAFPDSPNAFQQDQLQIGNEALIERMVALKEMQDRLDASKKLAAEEEKARAERTKLAMRDDRLSTSARVERERIGREARARLAQEQGESPTRSHAAPQPPQALSLMDQSDED